MIRRTAATLLTVLALAACEAQSPTPADVETGEAEGLPPVADPAQPAPPTGDTPPTDTPILAPIVRADWEGRLEPGGGCNLSRGDADFIVITVGDGVARVDGAVVDLTGVPTDFNAMTEGGTYVGGAATIRVALAPELGPQTQFEETFTRPVRVEVTAGDRVERYAASWTCGA